MSTSNIPDIVTDYKFGIKEEVIRALRPLFGPNYPDEQLRDKVMVSLEFPFEEQHYPAIYLTYTEGLVQNVGLGHHEYLLDDDGNISRFRHFKFSGQLNFNVLGLTTLDRDMLSAGLINIIAFAPDHPLFKRFYQELHDADYVRLQVLTDSITPGGESTANVPWGETDRLIYSNTYSIAAFGEFYSNTVTGGLVEIDTVNLYGYRPGDPVPTGVSDPAPWIEGDEEM